MHAEKRVEKEIRSLRLYVVQCLKSIFFNFSCGDKLFSACNLYDYFLLSWEFTDDVFSLRCHLFLLQTPLFSMFSPQRADCLSWGLKDREGHFVISRYLQVCHLWHGKLIMTMYSRGFDLIPLHTDGVLRWNIDRNVYF